MAVRSATVGILVCTDICLHLLPNPLNPSPQTLELQIPSPKPYCPLSQYNPNIALNPIQSPYNAILSHITLNPKPFGH